MTVVLSRNLLSLASVYRVPGGQLPPTNIDFASPIPLVHDVHREAEIGGGPGTYYGFSNISSVHTMAVAPSSVAVTSDPYSGPIMATLGINPQTHWAWLLEATVKITNTLTFAAGSLIIAQVGVAGALTTHQRLSHYWNEITVLGTTPGFSSAIRLGGEPPQITLPTIVPPNSTYIMSMSASGAIADIVGQILTWYGPQGVLPPGVA